MTDARAEASRRSLARYLRVRRPADNPGAGLQPVITATFGYAYVHARAASERLPLADRSDDYSNPHRVASRYAAFICDSLVGPFAVTQANLESYARPAARAYEAGAGRHRVGVPHA